MNTIELAPKLITDEDNIEYIVIAILENGKEIEDFEYFATDLAEFYKSLKDEGQYFVLTCWCGDPPCAGINIPINVKYKNEKIIWEVKEPFNRIIEFDRSQAIEGLKIFKSKMYELKRKSNFTKEEITPESNKEVFDKIVFK